MSERSVKDEEEEEDEEEGTKFFRETAATTNGQHFRLTDASRLVDIIVGVCCACYGPDLLQVEDTCFFFSILAEVKH